MTPIRSIARQAQRRDKLNILCCPTHERYETGLAQTGHNFYAYRGKEIKDWYTKYAPVPDNYILLDHGKLPANVEFDLVLSQNKYAQYQILKQISNRLHLPMINLEHVLPDPRWPDKTREYVASMKADLNIFISEFSRDAWGYKDDKATLVVHHMVDTDIFVPYTLFENRQAHLLSIVNDWMNRDYCCNFQGWQRISHGLPVHVRGDSEGLSTPTTTVEELVGEYNNSRVFLNTSTVSPVPTALLEAMACGCAVVSTATCMIPEIIENGVNGFLSNDEKQLREYCILLLQDTELAKKMGQAARQTILDRFHKDRFIKDWNIIFNEASKIPFVGAN
jgi:glycosyltransferase involved in cell wall biosynthesis